MTYINNGQHRGAIISTQTSEEKGSGVGSPLGVQTLLCKEFAGSACVCADSPPVQTVTDLSLNGCLSRYIFARVQGIK